ncbi:MAG: immunoglobulin-like domain-containing protein [Minisyncoccia bacterium]
MVVNKNNGFVGIGTSNPTFKLDVAGDMYASGVVQTPAYFYNQSKNGTQLFLNTDGANWGTLQNDSAGVWSMGWKNSLGAGLGNPVLSWTESGKVGVGTTSPVATLGIQGSIGVNASQLYLAANGNVGIGTTSSWAWGGIDAKLSISSPYAGFVRYGSVGNRTWQTYVDSGGAYVIADATSGTNRLNISTIGNLTIYGSGTTCTIGNGTGATNCTSDSRLKTNITSISGSDALTKLSLINGVTFNWADLSKDQTQRVGVIAQDVLRAFPQIVDTATTTFNGVEGNYYTVDYAALVSPLISGVNELNARTMFMQNAATSTVLTVDVAGNVGIGTTTPNHTLTVAGDIGAIAFVNTSTREAKTDISYVTSDASDAMLNQLVNLKLATYHYKIEDQADPLRLGFIAEEAQIIAPEILSPDGKGVDLYKLATFTLSGVQALAAKFDAQDVRITALEDRVAKLDGGAVSSASGSPISLSTTSLASALDAFGVLVDKGIAQFNTLVFRKLVASKDADGTSSAGSVSILTGNTVAQVNNSLVSPSTKVFVTFNSQITGSWWVSDKTAGSFRVVLSAPQTIDVSFDYFLVQTEGQMATSTPDGVQGSTLNLNPQGQTLNPDTVPPVITLLGDNPVHLSVGATFVEPGVTVFDAVDGTGTYITFINGIQQVVSAATIDTSSATTYIITYKATDRAGNMTIVTRSVIVGNQGGSTSLTTGGTISTSTPPVLSDVTPPTVTLVGSAIPQLTVGGTFTDTGATATDPSTGSGQATDLTAKIVVTGTVDTATIGSYTLTYTATDAAGNIGSVSRLVTVIAMP